MNWVSIDYWASKIVKFTVLLILLISACFAFIQFGKQIETLSPDAAFLKDKGINKLVLYTTVVINDSGKIERNEVYSEMENGQFLAECFTPFPHLKFGRHIPVIIEKDSYTIKRLSFWGVSDQEYIDSVNKIIACVKKSLL